MLKDVDQEWSSQGSSPVSLLILFLRTQNNMVLKVGRTNIFASSFPLEFPNFRSELMVRVQQLQ